MTKDTKARGRPLPPHSRDEDAVFLGWQRSASGDVFALFNITAAGHPSRGSTVTDKGLISLNLQVPRTPLRPLK